MSRNALPILLGLIFFAPVSLADYSDGFITTGEYEYGVIWTNSIQPLIVEGGGQML